MNNDTQSFSKTYRWTAQRVEDYDTIAPEILKAIGRHTTILFDAQMGAGKTTLISALCRALGSADDTGSPTFSIINEYLDAEGHPVYHFDFYRIDDPIELLDLGVEDYFNSGNLCFVEWGERGGSLLPDDAATLKIHINPDDSRTIQLTT